MILEIICNYINSLDPQRLSSQSAYLRMCVDSSPEQCAEMLDELIKHAQLSDDELMAALKLHRPDLVSKIGENAVEEAAEAYQIQRDRMATS